MASEDALPERPIGRRLSWEDFGVFEAYDDLDFDDYLA